MQLLNAIAEEIPHTVLQVVLSAVGFLLALAINSAINRHHEKKTYDVLLKAVCNEAHTNQKVWKESFIKYYKNGIVVREFIVISATQSLANPLFLRHATSENIETLSTYVLNLTLANGYRRVAENLILSEGVDHEVWLDSLLSMWGENLSASEESIRKVLAMNS